MFIVQSGGWSCDVLTNVALPRHQVHHATAHWTLELATKVREVRAFSLLKLKAPSTLLVLIIVSK